MEKEIREKKNHGSIIVIVILIILLLATIGYIVYDKVLVKTDSDKTDVVENTDKVTKEDIDINSSLVQNLYNIFKLDSCYKTSGTDGVESINSDNRIKLRIAYDNISKSSISSIECSKLGNVDNAYCGQMTSDMAAAYGENNMTKFKEYEKQNFTDSVNSDIVKNKYIELFGTDSEFKNESFGTGVSAEASCYFMNYDSNNNLYAQYNCEGGGTCVTPEQNIVSATKDGDKLFIVTNTKYPDETAKKVSYEFKKDKENSNYVFVKITA